jgi:hypothetical protein
VTDKKERKEEKSTLYPISPATVRHETKGKLERKGEQGRRRKDCGPKTGFRGDGVSYVVDAGQCRKQGPAEPDSRLSIRKMHHRLYVGL